MCLCLCVCVCACIHVCALPSHLLHSSLFVLLKGVSKDEAFRIGREITERVTAENPTPVKLKFEKVHCVGAGMQGRERAVFALVVGSVVNR